MAIRRNRTVRGVTTLNQRVEVTPPSASSFIDFAGPLLEEPHGTSIKDIAFAWCRTDSTPPPNNPVRFRAIIDNPDGETGPDFYPIGWFYKNLFSQPSVQERNQQRIIRKVYDNIPSHPYAYAMFPYLSEQFGLTLLIAKTRILDVFGERYASRTSEGGQVWIPGYNIFGMQELEGPGGHYHYPDLAERHLRFASVLNRYRETYGRFPPLYGDYLKALQEQAQNKNKRG